MSARNTNHAQAGLLPSNWWPHRAARASAAARVAWPVLGVWYPAEVPGLVISGMGTERRRAGPDIVVFLGVVVAGEGIGHGGSE